MACNDFEFNFRRFHKLWALPYLHVRHSLKYLIDILNISQNGYVSRPLDPLGLEFHYPNSALLISSTFSHILVLPFCT